jgi:hypothetical protein
MDTNENQPSQHQANKVLRVFKGERMKYTMRLHKLDGTIVEFQCNEMPKVEWNDSLRRPFLSNRDWSGHPITEWEPGMILLGEENPK